MSRAVLWYVHHVTVQTVQKAPEYVQLYKFCNSQNKTQFIKGRGEWENFSLHMSEKEILRLYQGSI